MTQKVVALLGLSGVGKTTVLKSIRQGISFQHLEASALIKQAREAKQDESVSTDSLRLSSIDENQRLLVSGFRSAIRPEQDLVVLDGHSIIDTPSGLVRIEPPVFSALGVQRLIFLADSPASILARRQADPTRNRPVRDIEALSHIQEEALLSGLAICLQLNIALTVVTPLQTDSIRSLLSF